MWSGNVKLRNTFRRFDNAFPSTAVHLFCRRLCHTGVPIRTRSKRVIVARHRETSHWINSKLDFIRAYCWTCLTLITSNNKAWYEKCFWRIKPCNGSKENFLEGKNSCEFCYLTWNSNGPEKLPTYDFGRNMTVDTMKKHR